MITKVHSFAVTVSDTDHAKQWYHDVLGLEVLEDQGHWVTVGRKDGGRIHLCETDKLETGNTGILLLCDNLDKSYSELVSRGVKFSKAPQDAGFGRFAIFNDPDGNAYWLME